MASIGIELRSWLLANSDVAALTTRISPAPLPQSAVLPAITYQRVDGKPLVSHGGNSGISRPRFQLDCWAADYAGADALAIAVSAALSARQWTNQSFVDADRDMPDPETGNYRRIVDVFIWHKE